MFTLDACACQPAKDHAIFQWYWYCYSCYYPCINVFLIDGPWFSLHTLDHHWSPPWLQCDVVKSRYKWCSRRSAEHRHMSLHIHKFLYTSLYLLIFYFNLHVWNSLLQHSHEMIIGVIIFKGYEQHISFIFFKPTVVEKQNTKQVISMNYLWIHFFMYSYSSSRVQLNSVIRLKLAFQFIKKGPKPTQAFFEHQKVSKDVCVFELEDVLDVLEVLDEADATSSSSSKKFQNNTRLRGSMYMSCICLMSGDVKYRRRFQSPKTFRGLKRDQWER